MKKNGLIRSVIDAIKDHNRDFSERMFLIFTIITEISVIVALIGDFFIGESKGEIITIVLTLTLVPILTVCHKIDLHRSGICYSTFAFLLRRRP